LQQQTTTRQQKENMKTKYAVAIVTIGLAVAASLFAAEQKTDKTTPRVIFLKANGEAIAQLTLLKDDTFEIFRGDTNKDASINVNLTTGEVYSKNGFTIKISRDGNVFPITVKADEIAMPHSDK
jgi:hypothetical protein